MQIRIEFFGIARSRAGISECELSFGGGGAVTIGRVLEELAIRFPGLREECIANGQLTPAFTMNRNGERFVRDVALELRDGDSLLLLSADAGG